MNPLLKWIVRNLRTNVRGVKMWGVKNILPPHIEFQRLKQLHPLGEDRWLGWTVGLGLAGAGGKGGKYGGFIGLDRSRM